MGGLRNEDLIQEKIKKVEEIFNAQKSKNIFLAVMIAFKERYIYSMCGVVGFTVLHMTFPMIITKIVSFMEDKESQDFSYVMKLLFLLIFNLRFVFHSQIFNVFLFF